MRLHQIKEDINQIKRPPTEWGNIFADTSDKELICIIYEELTKLNHKKDPQAQLKNMQRS